MFEQVMVSQVSRKNRSFFVKNHWLLSTIATSRVGRGRRNGHTDTQTDRQTDRQLGGGRSGRSEGLGEVGGGRE